MRHTLEESNAGGATRRCTICQWQWRSNSVIKSSCPGIPRYGFGTYNPCPENYKTFTQMAALGYKPLDRTKPVGCYLSAKNEWVYLHDMNAAIKKREQTDAQKEARLKAWKTTQELYRCPECKCAPSSLSRVKDYNKQSPCDECRERIAYENEQDALDAHIKEDHTLACQWARDMLTSGDFCILDTETTDLNVRRIVELSIIGPDGKALFDRVINPEHEVSSIARSIHQIQDEEMQHAPTLPDVWDNIVAILSRYKTIVVYNADFDKYALKWHAEHYNLPVPKWHYECLMLQYSEYCGEWSEYHGSYRWQRLPDGDHRALGDCKASPKLMQQMSEQLDRIPTEEAETTEDALLTKGGVGHRVQSNSAP